jgi:hypothetical protein
MRFVLHLVAASLFTSAAVAEDVTHIDVGGAPSGTSAGAGDCVGNVILSQSPAWVSAGASQDELATDPGCTTGPLVAELADDFAPDPRPCTGVRFWGLTGGTFFNESTWDVEFYPDEGGVPGEVFYAQRTATATNTAVDGVPDFLNFEHCILFDEPVDISAGGWLVVQAQFCRSTGDVSNSQWFHELHDRENGSQVYFRAPLFEYFTFTPGAEVFDGAMYDTGWELLTDSPVPARSASWGELKLLYR